MTALVVEHLTALTPKGLSEVPDATKVSQGANGTSQLVPQVPHPFRGGPGTDTEPGTSDADPEFERGDAWEPDDGEVA